MFVFALVSLAFSGWLAWTLASSLHGEKPSGLMDYLSTVWLGGGSLAGIIVAISSLLKAFF